jgi:hypothetical protein
MTNTLDAQPYEPALQATSQPINENASCRNRLIDGLSRSEKLQKWLSGALNGTPCLLLPLRVPAIHNYQLLIISRDFWPVTNFAKTEQLPGSIPIISKKPLTCTHLQVPHWSEKFHQFCTMGYKWVENEKMETSIFSVFNLKKTRPYLAELCKVEIFRNVVEKNTTLHNSARYGTHSPLLPSFPACHYTQLAIAVQGAEQVTRSLLDTCALLLLLARLLRSLFQFPIAESEML